jgi:hypothetical protein
VGETKTILVVDESLAKAARRRPAHGGQKNGRLSKFGDGLRSKTDVAMGQRNALQNSLS